MDKATKALIKQGMRYARKHKPKTTTKQVKAPSVRKTSSKVIPKDTTIQVSKRGRPLDSQVRHDVVQELRKEYNKLRRRIDNIQNKYGDLPAVEDFYNKGLDNFSTKGKTLEDLNKLKLDVEYVSSLRTSYVKGAVNYQQYVAEWLDLYDRDRNAYDQIMTMYNRMVEENELTEKFKYEIIEEIYTLVETQGHLSPAELDAKVREKFEELYVKSIDNETILGGTSYATNGKVR